MAGIQKAITVDPKRTGVKASVIAWTEPPMYLVDHRWYGPIGAFIQRNLANEANNWILCCPGCGQLGSPRHGATWQCTQGSFDDVAALTLSPSIATGCCGWHGYLKNGTFESC